jgi:sensor histidine kinase regulating citrate/malate metabolism
LGNCWEQRHQHIQHGAGRLAERNDKDFLVAGQIDRIRTAAVGQQAVHRIAVKANAAIKGRLNVARRNGAGKDIVGGRVQNIEGGIADRGHGSCSFSQPLRADCIGSS